MNGIFDTAVNAFRVESIRKRLLYTFMILGIFMLGALYLYPELMARNSHVSFSSGDSLEASWTSSQVVDYYMLPSCL